MISDARLFATGVLLIPRAHSGSRFAQTTGPSPQSRQELRLSVIVPLVAACIVIVLLIPFAALRGKLRSSIYLGMALVAFAASVWFGRISRSPANMGAAQGTVLSVFCFLLLATALGSLCASMLYRRALK